MTTAFIAFGVIFVLLIVLTPLDKPMPTKTVKEIKSVSDLIFPHFS